MIIKLATRTSPLALWQARFITGLLISRDSSLEVIEVGVESTGDRVQDRPLGQIGGDGLFTKEIQAAVLDGRAHAAVHSLKDLPTAPVPGMRLSAVPKRGPTGDAFVSRKHSSFERLPKGARLGTSSIRRKAQLLWHRPDLEIVDLRGNVDTRLKKLVDQELDGIILAEAGLLRLGYESQITEILDRNWMLPAVGQGAVGVETGTESRPENDQIEATNDPQTLAEVLAERSFLVELGGGCLIPVGVDTKCVGQNLELKGVVIACDGKRRLEAKLAADLSCPIELGRQLAKILLDQGAGEILGL
jgi:hydroxymethylbilane synthase